MKAHVTRMLKTIFFIQIGVLCLMAILFAVGSAKNCVDVGSLFFALLFGALGASISLMRKVQSGATLSLVQAQEMKLFAVLMPILYGTLMAGIAYLFFVSEILTGKGGDGMIVTDLFPNFDWGKQEDDLNIFQEFMALRPEELVDYGKLFVWCFLAGYSENLITGILQKLEDQTKN